MENPDRRFIDCSLFQRKGCAFFEWVDPPLSEREKEVIIILHEKNTKLEVDLEAQVGNPEHVTSSTITLRYPFMTLFLVRVKWFGIGIIFGLVMYPLYVFFKQNEMKWVV